MCSCIIAMCIYNQWSWKGHKDVIKDSTISWPRWTWAIYITHLQMRKCLKVRTCTNVQQFYELATSVCKIGDNGVTVSGVLWKHLLWPLGDNLNSGFKNQAYFFITLQQPRNARHLPVVITGPNGALPRGELLAFSPQALRIFPFFFFFFWNSDTSLFLVMLSILKSYDKSYP